MTDIPSSASTRKPGRTLTILGAVLAVVAIIFLPIIFGPVGAILGFVGYSKGDKPAGLYVGIGGIITTILGLLIGALVFSSMNN